MKKLKKAYPLILLLTFIIFTGFYVGNIIQKTSFEKKEFIHIYFNALFIIITLMTLIWLLSIYLKNVSIVDPFWGLIFVLIGVYYFLNTEHATPRKIITLLLLSIWGLRLSAYLLIRNWHKPEDFRYQKFRKDYGVKRYWWFSFFQVFLLQGILLWIISAPILSIQYFSAEKGLYFIDYLAMLIWIVGFLFEVFGDYQLMKFKKKPENKGKVLTAGLWKYTRHPNYFGDAAIWWSFGLFSIAVESYLPLISCLVMTLLLLKVSGVSLLERTLKETKPDYQSYMNKTSSFFPWFPKNTN